MNGAQVQIILAAGMKVRRVLDPAVFHLQVFEDGGAVDQSARRQRNANLSPGAEGDPDEHRFGTVVLEPERMPDGRGKLLVHLGKPATTTTQSEPEKLARLNIPAKEAA